MASFVQRIIRVSTLISALILGFMPLVIAIDFGGYLWWSKYLASFAVLAAFAFSIPGLFASDNPRTLSQYSLLVPLMIWLIFAALQTAPMSSSLVKSLSPASLSAYSDWASAFAQSGKSPSFIPISISPESSRHSVAVFGLVIVIAWTSSHIFQSRFRIALFLNIVACSVTVFAVFGIARMIYPEITLFGVETTWHGFGSFINRNNAALFLNLGMACSLGLLAWRLSALTGLDVDDPQFEINDLVALVSDRDSMFGCLGVVGSSAGLLVCGSRGGIVSGILGLLLALGWVRQSRGFKTIPVLGVAIGLAVICFLAPLKLEFRSLTRLKAAAEQGAIGVTQDARFGHWRDGFETAKASLPAGTGLGTYGFAYLPHQQGSASGWHHHADNLWLELFAEQGFVGIIISLTLLALFIRIMSYLEASNDAIDHGLRVTGWYVVGSLLVSQTFDFGLILTANLFLFTAIVMMIASRANLSASSSRKRIHFRTTRSTALIIAVAGMIGGIGAWSMQHLRRDANVELLEKTVAHSIRRIKTNPRELVKLDQQLHSSPSFDSSPRLLNASWTIRNQLARLIEVEIEAPSNPEAIRTAYRNSGSVSNRRSLYDRFASRVPLDPEDLADLASEQSPGSRLVNLFRDSLAQAERSLELEPLGLQPRSLQLQLDFVHGDQERAFKAFDQIRDMHPRNANTLFRLGVYAAGSDRPDLASEVWLTSLQEQPNFTTRIIRQAQQHAEIQLAEILPENRFVYRSVAKHLLNQEHPSRDLARIALERIECQNSATLQEKAKCHEIAGDLNYFLEEFQAAFISYDRSLKLTPANTNLHLKFIRRLRDAGYNRHALSAARRARALLPSVGNFTRLIEKMASEDILESEEKPSE